MDNESKIGQVNIPTLVPHGEQDSTVPLSHGWRVSKLAGGTKRFHAIEGAGHNDTWVVGSRRGKALRRGVERFLEKRRQPVTRARSHQGQVARRLTLDGEATVADIGNAYLGGVMRYIAAVGAGGVVLG